jgi:hypothetical protein
METIMLQLLYKFAVVAALGLINGGLIQAQDSPDDSKKDVAAERRALLDTLSTTIEKLQELGGSDGQDAGIATNIALSWWMKQHKPNGQWRLTQPNAKSLRDFSRWYFSVDPQPRVTHLEANYRMTDVLGRYARVNDQLENFAQLAADAIKPSPFWIGVQCEPVESYELTVDDTHVVTVSGGMKVNAVTDESPAKEAGISTDDILVFFNESPVNEIGQLVWAIGENEDKPAELSVVRDQKMIKVELTPTLRKQETENENTSDAEAKKADDLYSFYVDLQFAPNALPDDYEANVRYKKGDAVSLTLTKGEETWEVTSDSVSELPEDSRGFASQVFESTSSLVEPGGGMADFLVQPEAAKTMRPVGLNSKTNELFFYQMLQGNSATKLDKIQKQLNELQDAVNQLKGK